MHHPIWPWLIVSILPLLGAIASSADEFAPTPAKEWELKERKTIRYEHSCPAQWGYENPKPQYFYVMLPKEKKDAPAPLLLYLHSASGSDGENADTEMQEFGGDWVVKAGPDFIGLMPHSEVRSKDGWWGDHALQSDPQKYAQLMAPTEQRVMATLEWVLQKYNVDRNRIYLCGVSMGGSGSLGLGMCHGDTFASISVIVPAGATHVLRRMRFPDALSATASPAEKQAYLCAVSGNGLPDAPPIVNFSSQTDDYSKGQPDLLRAAHDGRQALVFAWGPWGHSAKIDRHNRAAVEYPWLGIRKNEAYPVFTNASTDQQYPGSNPPKPDAEGQINAYFRWKNISDAADGFSIELRLVQNSELTAPIPIPENSVADVTLRRLQKFKVQAGGKYDWTFGSKQSGTVQSDAAGLLTFPRLAIGAQPQRLTLKPRR